MPTLDDEIRGFNEKEYITSIDREVRRLVMNSKVAMRERYHSMLPDPQIFNPTLGKICGTKVETLPDVITVMFDSMCFMHSSLIETIIRILNKNGYEHINKCNTCYHFKDNGCYLKGYKQNKNPQDFCSSHSSCTHGSDNQPAS